MDRLLSDRIFRAQLAVVVAALVGWSVLLAGSFAFLEGSELYGAILFVAGFMIAIHGPLSLTTHFQFPGARLWRSLERGP